MLFVFPLNVLGEIWDVIEPVSEEFLTYSFITSHFASCYILCSK